MQVRNQLISRDQLTGQALSVIFRRSHAPICCISDYIRSRILQEGKPEKQENQESFS